MNVYTIFNFQRIVFMILFILLGIYLGLFLIKEIYYLFLPPKEIAQNIVEIKSDKEDQIIKYFSQKQKSKDQERKSRKRRKNKS